MIKHLYSARFTIPTRRPLLARVWYWWRIRTLTEQLRCLQQERDSYQAAADAPGSEFKLGPQYLANCAQQEKELKAQISMLEVLS